MKALNVLALVSIIFAATTFGINQTNNLVKDTAKSSQVGLANAPTPSDEVYAWVVSQNAKAKVVTNYND